jgi:periplasmic divalent cation tolerance protein
MRPAPGSPASNTNPAPNRNSGFVLLLTTAGSREDGEAIARALVKKRLAACVQVVGGVTSFYRWKGALERDEEALILIKTREGLTGEIEKQFESLHLYEVPELVTLPITSGSEGYLKWLDENIRLE